MTVSLNFLSNYLFSFSLGFLFVYSFRAYSSVSPLCLTFGVWSSKLDEIALSPNLDRMASVDSGVVGGMWGCWDAA